MKSINWDFSETWRRVHWLPKTAMFGWAGYQVFDVLGRISVITVFDSFALGYIAGSFLGVALHAISPFIVERIASRKNWNPNLAFFAGVLSWIAIPLYALATFLPIPEGKRRLYSKSS